MTILSNDRDLAETVGVAVRNIMEDLDLTPEEAIPGLVEAIFLVAKDTQNAGKALDEAADLLTENRA